ncbi:uncharacterized protein EKO05_0002952 [Ascochyta rabiei]|uniref:uncharacterized protein n=1 Tax=Didymella rabiei TaxID=5454 RepID=UPI00220201B1|nr:uncharacterized protein EKO05_0002952 [Ascochyta rabiei]UPX12404.1 hypothetical protein EKO05_0002952 [Ascochyta rabiei]
MNLRRKTLDSIYAATMAMHSNGTVELVRRPSLTVEPQRLHCAAMRETKSQGIKESEHSWYIQGNEVAREASIFEGEMIKRYNITRGCEANPVRTTGEGAGSGDDFIDTSERDDLICVWARAKVSSTILR